MAVPATASPAFPLDPTLAACPSQPLFHRVLRRPLDFTQYVSVIFGHTARAAGIDISIGAKGCALDNAVCESFFATLNNELTRRRSWPTRQELKSAVFA